MVAVRKAKKGEKGGEVTASHNEKEAIEHHVTPMEEDEPLLLAPDSMQNQAMLRDLLSSLLHLVRDPTSLLQPRPDIALSARSLSTALYSYCLRHLLSSSTKGEAKVIRGQRGGNLAESLLPELHAGEGFDAEQIWMQLELASGASLKRVRRLMGKAEGVGKDGPESLVKAEFLAHLDELVDEEDEGGDPLDEDVEDEGEDEEGEGGEMDEDEDDDKAEAERQLKKKGPKLKASGREQTRASGQSVEDEHFKLSEMERFLEDAEAKDARGDDDDGEDDEGDGDEDEDEDEEGGFDDEDDEDEDEEMADLLRNSAQIVGRKAGGALKKKGDDARGLMYRDFYGEADELGEGDEEEEEEEGEEEEEEEDKGLEEEPDEGGVEIDDVDALLEEEGGGGKPKKTRPDLKDPKDLKKTRPDLSEMSTHEKRLARLQEKIADLEKTAMSEKEWQLRGEAGATGRPINSALEVDLDFETTVKPPPQPTEEMMGDIEALIKRRIAEHKFDNVVRLVPPPLFASKKVLELDEGRSKKGLGEIYESDFVDKRDEAGGFEPPAGSGKDKDGKIRLEAKGLFNALVAKLDALSHFHFTPKPAVEELVVRTDVAAVLMEEAAPVTVSHASMRLPTEVFKQSDATRKAPGGLSAPVAEGEMSREDKKRRRAQKKRAGKAAKRSKGGDHGVESTLKAKEEALILSRAGKREKASSTQGGGRGEFGKSAAVFGRLQDEAGAKAAGLGGEGSKSGKGGKAVVTSSSALRL